MAKMVFLMVNNFFLSVFRNTEQNNNCIFIVFKAESEPKHKDKFFLAVFLQKPKTCFFGGKHKIVLKLKFQICISVFVLYCERKLHTNFHKKNWNLSPLEFFENENFDMRAEILDLDF